MTSREESVLAARDPSLNDENDWEEFSLSDVKILFPGKSRYANLLSASPDNPVQVVGRLEEVEEEQEPLILDDDYLSKRIVIENVAHYAYGQHDDGEVGIWVAGRAGWFSISPARGYRPIFNDMVEAIDLLYFLTDRHQKRRTRRRNSNPSVQYLCEEYVHHTHGICEDVDDSAEVFYKHHNFLLSRMLKGEGVGWVETNLFKHLCEKFPRIKALLAPKEQEEDEEEEEEEEEDDDDDDDDDVTNEDDEPNGFSESQVIAPDSDSTSKMQADSIYKVIVDLKEEGHLAKRQLNLDLVIFTLTSRYEIDNAEYARDLIAARAGILVDMMDEAKTSNFDWSRKAIYRDLKSQSQQNHPQYLTLTPLRPRLPEHGGSSSSEESSDEYNAKGLRRRVRKSLLRPKSSVSSKRVGKGTRSTVATEQEDFSDSSEDSLKDLETPSKARGHEFARDPLSTRARRRTRSILSDPGSMTPLQKTPLQETLQSRNASVSTGDRGASEPADNSYPSDLPPDTWVCRVKGCRKIIYKSSSKRGKEIIQDHSLAHADDMQAKIDLVFAEQRLNVNLPVDHLIERIRNFGALDPDPSTENEASKRIRT
ncbi:hypothetical protein MPDQ_000016 [Monascus purpureus]|uniref:DNA (cytosine-5)-methyltransferase 1 replication foci domain-containing protein n=1 Tax=Monascus purpureus TaxID=5098 RepID=A0A507R6W4_MONPU|nr:hypothetical protein MPDQ_000016 [Monascus purpureus]